MPTKTVKKTQLLSLSAIALLTLLALIVVLQRHAPGAGAADRIENGLLTTVVIKGQRAPMKLVDRMAYYGVPGISIAVINNGQLAWAKGYGLLEAVAQDVLPPIRVFKPRQSASRSQLWLRWSSFSAA